MSTPPAESAGPCLISDLRLREQAQRVAGRAAGVKATGSPTAVDMFCELTVKPSAKLPKRSIATLPIRRWTNAGAPTGCGA